MKELNLNDWVFVRLTEIGRQHHRADFARWTAEAGLSIQYKPPMEDDDGWSRWQLWDLIHLFGPLCGLGFQVPFETTMRVQTKPSDHD